MRDADTRAAQWCRITLERQLTTTTEEGEAAMHEWAKNAGGLADYYIAAEMWVAAQRCLDAADYMLERYRALLPCPPRAPTARRTLAVAPSNSPL